METYLIVIAVVGGIVAFSLLLAFLFRTVVATNVVHIVQSRSKTTSYGTGQTIGNVYYAWPSFIPIVGVTSIVLPVNNFDIPLPGYKAYDKDRVPFELDVVGFFHINDTNMAAERVLSFENLKHQLTNIMQGAVRKILASHEINTIMIDRATFGQQFTDEVRNELVQWGVEPVKNMELMDIRDDKESEVIANIMAMKKSQIEMTSRQAVAGNLQAARTAEIDAEQAVNIRQQDAEQAVGQRTAEKTKQVGISEQKAKQEITAEKAVTVAREMDVLQVGKVRDAEIIRAAQLVTADQNKQVQVVAAEANLEQARRDAEGIKARGDANAFAAKQMQLAPVEAQIVLAKEIGGNDGYQKYLITIEGIKASQLVGIAQAAALEKAEVKIFSNTSDPSSGLSSARELFSSKGGLQLGAFLEGLRATPEGESVLDAITPEPTPKPNGNPKP